MRSIESMGLPYQTIKTGYHVERVDHLVLIADVPDHGSMPATRSNTPNEGRDG